MLKKIVCKKFCIDALKRRERVSGEWVESEWRVREGERVERETEREQENERESSKCKQRIQTFSTRKRFQWFCLIFYENGAKHEISKLQRRRRAFPDVVWFVSSWLSFILIFIVASRVRFPSFHKQLAYANPELSPNCFSPLAKPIILCSIFSHHVSPHSSARANTFHNPLLSNSTSIIIQKQSTFYDRSLWINLKLRLAIYLRPNNFRQFWPVLSLIN